MTSHLQHLELVSQQQALQQLGLQLLLLQCFEVVTLELAAQLLFFQELLVALGQLQGAVLHLGQLVPQQGVEQRTQIVQQWSASLVHAGRDLETVVQEQVAECSPLQGAPDAVLRRSARSGVHQQQFVESRHASALYPVEVLEGMLKQGGVLGVLSDSVALGWQALRLC